MEKVQDLATRPLAEPMNATSAAVAHDVDEFALAGLTAAACRIVSAPRVAESPVSMECRLTQLIQLTRIGGEAVPNWLALGEVVGVHIDRAFLKDGVYDTAAARPVLRAGGAGTYYEITPDAMFKMRRPKGSADG